MANEISVTIKVEPVNVDGVDCITVNDYARVVGKSVQLIYGSIKEEKIMSINKLGKTLIPITELPEGSFDE